MSPPPHPDHLPCALLLCGSPEGCNVSSIVCGACAVTETPPIPRMRGPRGSRPAGHRCAQQAQRAQQPQHVSALSALTVMLSCQRQSRHSRSRPLPRCKSSSCRGWSAPLLLLLRPLLDGDLQRGAPLLSLPLAAQRHFQSRQNAAVLGLLLPHCKKLGSARGGIGSQGSEGVSCATG